jgi:hypothetical protein
VECCTPRAQCTFRSVESIDEVRNFKKVRSSRERRTAVLSAETLEYRRVTEHEQWGEKVQEGRGES